LSVKEFRFPAVLLLNNVILLQFYIYYGQLSVTVYIFMFTM